LKDIASLVVKAGLRPTKADVKRLISQGGLSINGAQVSSEEKAKERPELMHGKYVVIKVGKKSFSLVEITYK
jgi:tyrosyl-tRNA synthetase